MIEERVTQWADGTPVVPCPVAEAVRDHFNGGAVMANLSEGAVLDCKVCYLRDTDIAGAMQWVEKRYPKAHVKGVFTHDDGDVMVSFTIKVEDLPHE